MNFYSFHIGDYAGATRHLSWDEDMAYRRLMDAYYAREAPLPVDRKQIYRLVSAQSAKQREAVDAVLGEFFSETDQGFRNVRCEEELAAFAAKRGKASQSAQLRWEAERAKRPHSEGNAEAMRTHSEGNAPTTHNPLPSKDGGVGSARARSLDLETQLREAAGWQSEPAPNLAVTGPIEALLGSGAILELDVLPVVRAIAPQASSRTSWKYFVKAIARARDDRIAAAKIVSPNGGAHGNHSRNPQRVTTGASLAATFAGKHGEGDPSAGDADPGEPEHKTGFAGRL